VRVPEVRIEVRNRRPVRGDGRYVLYWMTAARRTRFHFGLQRAAELARELARPLLVFEALRCDHPWASDRTHAFVLDGMRANAAACAARGVTYLPYVERERGAGRGLLAALWGEACAVVTDDFPCFFLPRMVATAAERCPVRLEAVDGNGLLPMRLADRAFPTAYAFRRFLQAELLPHLACPPEEDPLAGVGGAPVPEAARRWPAGVPDGPAGLPVDHDVPALAMEPPRTVLARFVEERLARYAEDRNRPAIEGASGLSPYLHFGRISAHEVFRAVAAREGWSPERAGPGAAGKRAGWWGMGEGAEAFLDQLVTWRELGFNFCARRPEDYDRYESLPGWALETLAAHEADPRDPVYAPEELAAARTHDAIWNAAQRQLVREGRIHNYLRMLWGKKVLQWSPTPRAALATLIELNNRYALDGRDPNSYSGIFWCLGRYDRAWGPERPVFGKVRYMTSENTARKLDLRPWLARFGAP